MRRAVFYISDGTGITAETIGHSVLTQFADVEFATARIPFVDSVEKANLVVERIRSEALRLGNKAIVISSVVDQKIAARIAESGALMLDIFAPFIAPIERELQIQHKPKVGQAHGLVDMVEYESRINATNYAMSHDDGVNMNYSEAEVILVGVSRSGKTPTCLYLALHYGVRAGNYPLTEEDLEKAELPAKLLPYRHRLFGLTIDPARLRQVRETRKPGSRYATIEQCRYEVAEAEKLIKRESIPMLSTTHSSIEEIGSKVLQSLGLNRHMF